MTLANAPVVVNMPAVDLERVRTFYNQTLGLKEVHTNEAGIMFEAGNGTRLYLYQRGPTKADHTAASFKVEDVEETVKELKDKGVTFEQYDEPMKTDEDGIATMGDIKAAWFKDTEGNILCVANA